MIALYIILAFYAGAGVVFIFMAWALDGSNFIIKGSEENLFLLIVDRLLFGILWLPLLLKKIFL